MNLKLPASNFSLKYHYHHHHHCKGRIGSSVFQHKGKDRVIRVVSIKSLLVISMLCKTVSSWELRTWSHKMNLLDILSTPPHYFRRKWIEATKENSNFDLKISRAKPVPYPHPRWSGLYHPASPARVALSGDIALGSRTLGHSEKLKLRDLANIW